MATETHIAGLQMDVSKRYLLQRCAWCGAVMLSYDRSRVAVLGDEYRDPALFDVGRLVRFSYDGPVARWGEVALSRTVMWMLDETDELPDDACALNIPLEDDEPPRSPEGCALMESDRERLLREAVESLVDVMPYLHPNPNSLRAKEWARWREEALDKAAVALEEVRDVH